MKRLRGIDKIRRCLDKFCKRNALPEPVARGDEIFNTFSFQQVVLWAKNTSGNGMLLA
jgi:hypothetical protein